MFNRLGKGFLIVIVVMQFAVLATGCQGVDNRNIGHGIVSDADDRDDVDASENDIDYITSMIINNALISSRNEAIASSKNSDDTVKSDNKKASISSKTNKGNEGLNAKNRVSASRSSASTSKSKASNNSSASKSKVSISKSRIGSSTTHTSTRSTRTKR